MVIIKLTCDSYLRDPSFSDFIIWDDSGAEYKVHRYVISSHSKYFAKLCGGDFLESTFREVTLRDDPPQAVKLMIDFFYQFQYTAYVKTVCKGEDHATPAPSTLQVHAWMFTIADKYEILDLKSYALKSFEHVGNVFNAPEVLVGLVPYIYTESPLHDDGLRKAIVRMWAHRRHKHLTSAISKGAWEAILRDCPAFGADLLEHMARR